MHNVVNMFYLTTSLRKLHSLLLDAIRLLSDFNPFSIRNFALLFKIVRPEDLITLKGTYLKI